MKRPKLQKHKIERNIMHSRKCLKLLQHKFLLMKTCINCGNLLKPTHKLFHSSKSVKHKFSLKDQTACQKYPSRSYCTEQNRSSALSPAINEPIAVYIKIDDLFENTEQLDLDLQKRNLDMNIDEQYKAFKEYKALQRKKVKLELEKDKVTATIKRLTRAADPSKEEMISYARDNVKRINSALKALKPNYVILQNKVIHDALKLPNCLHYSVPERTQILGTKGETTINSETAKSHIVIASENHWIKKSRSTNSNYYLFGELVKLLNTLQEKLTEFTEISGLTAMFCPHIVRTIVYEGCGYTYSKHKPGFLLQQKKEKRAHGVQHDFPFYLTGVSPTSFIAYLMRMNISKDSLPLQWYSIGSSYSQKSCDSTETDSGLHTSSQSEVLEVFGCTATKGDMENVYLKYCDMMEKIFDFLGLPVQYVELGAPDLDVMECARKEVHVWMPSLNSHVKVGHVAMWGDYSSRRLMINQIEKGGAKSMGSIVYTVHGTLVDLMTLIAAAIENHQTENEDNITFPEKWYSGDIADFTTDNCVH